MCFGSSEEQRTPPLSEPPTTVHRGWSVRNRDVEALAHYLRSKRPETVEGPIGAEKALASAKGLDDFLTGACEASMPTQRPGPPGKRPVHWWTEEIAELRRKCLALRRVYQHQSKRVGQPGNQEARFCFIAARRNLRTAIREAKRKCWSDLCDQVDEDPWGKPYKLVMGNLPQQWRGFERQRGRDS